MPQNDVQAKRRGMFLFPESPIQPLPINESTWDQAVAQYMSDNPGKTEDSEGSFREIRSISNDLRIAEHIRFVRETRDGTGQGGRDSTFIKEAEKFKGLNPNLDVTIKPFYGEDELAQSIQEMQNQAGSDTVDVGILGHADLKFGGVAVDKFPELVKGDDDTCGNVGGVYVGSCNYGTDYFSESRDSLSVAFNAPVFAQDRFWKGFRARTKTEEKDLISSGSDQLGSRIFTPGANVTKTPVAKRYALYKEPTIAKPGEF